MMTIRFPDGLSITYNNAGYLEWRDDGSCRLRVKKDGNTIAFVPREALIEWVRPCRIGRVGIDKAQALKQVRDALRERSIGGDLLDARLLAEIKLLLRDFDARKTCWK